MAFTNEHYESLRAIFQCQRLPLAFVDLDAFDANVAYAAHFAQAAGKTLRIGTKSLRCVSLMERALAHPSAVLRGFLTFTTEETAFLAQKGHDDFLIAYPTVQPSDMEILASLTKAGKQVSLMVDNIQHLKALDAVGKKYGVLLHVAMEVDMAYRPFGTDAVHLGLRRSPIRTPEQATVFVNQAKKYSNIKIDAVMGYEGHIAGTKDDMPHQAIKNARLRLLKNASVKELTSRRGAVIQALEQAGIELRVVNGGGSGSLVTTLKDESVTEATIGSGLYASGLFHYFKDVKYQPAAFFALQVVRVPKQGMVTCAGGGYVASGEITKGKLPVPVMPVGLHFLDSEGAGEVQTPLVLAKDSPDVHLGDPIFFQHAKAGELCERFNELVLIKQGRIVDRVKTYRGEGMCFL